MRDSDCVQFLQWALPRMHLRWPGFRKVRRQVCRRVASRLRQLDLATVSTYRSFLEQHPEEWEVLDSLCRVTISRFHRDDGVFAFVRQELLPALAKACQARDHRSIDAWSVGCASGEEPYTLSILWELELQADLPALDLRILATDADPAMIQRAQRARYPASSLKHLPEPWRARAFEVAGRGFALRRKLAERVRFLCHDVRNEQSFGPFHLVLCRNLAFTYFDLDLQRAVAGSLKRSLWPGGALIVGGNETLPPTTSGFRPWPGGRGVYRGG